MDIRPEIEIGNIGIQNSELDLQGAKMGYAPRLSLSASSGTNNSSGGNFGRQIKNNWSNSLGLNLSIPIYSQRQNKSAVEKARNYLEQCQIAFAVYIRNVGGDHSL